ncbi:MAG: M36 family metallopeptidase [Chloroflexota bacterium]|nr:M36 family metallopeptidase [Chloroflexota bacterium]
MSSKRKEPQKFLRGIAAVSVAISLLALVMLLPASTLAAPATEPTLNCAEILWHSLTGTPKTLRNCITPNLFEADAAETATTFLKRHRSLFGLPVGLPDLALVSVKHGLDSSHVLFQQTYNDLPVYGAYVSVHLDKDDQVQVLHNGYLAEIQVPDDQASVSAVEAVQIARDAIGFNAPRNDSPAPVKEILPRGHDHGRQIWRVMVIAADPQGDWEVLVDALSGDVIKRYNRLVFARGRVFQSSPAQQSEAGEPDLQTLPLQGLDDSGWLRGEHVDVTQPEGYIPAQAFSVDGEFIYNPDDPRFEEVMVYYHIDSTQRYIESLGYSDEHDPPNGIRDRVTNASAHWFDLDQSFYSVSDDALHFGDGGVQDAEDADLIVHEYAHALQHDQLACWGGGDMEIIGEGFGDYLAASRFASQSEDPACIAEWDSTSYASGPPYCLRRVDRNRQYPEGLSGDTHTDGELWSRILWDLRSHLGSQAADTLALESNYYLPCQASLADAGRALLDAGVNLFDGAHQLVIEEVLMSRGLLALPAPTIALATNGDLIAPHNLVPIAEEPNHSLPASYEVQYTLEGNASDDRLDTFNGGLPVDYDTFGNEEWLAENNSIRPGAIGHNQSSNLTLDVSLTRPGELKFRYRVSSEQGWDKLAFFVDDTLLLETSDNAVWKRFSTTLSPGSHRLWWRYSKDSTLSSGQDTAWIDDLSIENVQSAVWQDATLVETAPVDGILTWRVPEENTLEGAIRMRTVVDGLTSPWATASERVWIDEPTAVEVSDFESQPMQADYSGWGTTGALILLTALSLAALILLTRRGHFTS